MLLDQGAISYTAQKRSSLSERYCPHSSYVSDIEILPSASTDLYFANKTV